MTAVEAVCMAFVTGLTACGVMGSALELASGARLSFSPPFVSTGRIGRSLLVTAAAGPFMLANEALAARRDRAVSAVQFWSCITVSGLWALAAGIVVLNLALRAVTLLS